jgi:hypothetical protein
MTDARIRQRRAGEQAGTARERGLPDAITGQVAPTTSVSLPAANTIVRYIPTEAVLRAAR